MTVPTRRRRPRRGSTLLVAVALVAAGIQAVATGPEALAAGGEVDWVVESPATERPRAELIGVGDSTGTDCTVFGSAVATGCVISDLTPTLTITGSDTGAVVISDGSSPDGDFLWRSDESDLSDGDSYTVPDGVLAAGQSYQWALQPSTSDASDVDLSWQGFTIDLLRQGKEPTDTFGPITTGLASQTAQLSISGDQVSTASGNVGLGLAYVGPYWGTSTGAPYVVDEPTGTLPDGWVLSGIGTSTDLVQVSAITPIAGSGTRAVLVEASNGSTTEFTSTGGGAGSWAPPVGTGQPADQYGALTLSDDLSTFTWTSGTTVVTFTQSSSDSDVWLATDEQQIVSGTDQLSPGISLGWDDQGRLATVSDQNTVDSSGTATATGTFSYGGDSGCASPSGDDDLIAAPDGYLCSYENLDGTVNDVFYREVTDGVYQIGQVSLAGGAAWTLAWQTRTVTTTAGDETVAELLGVQSPMGLDAETAGTAAESDTMWWIAYSSLFGEIEGVVSPLPSVGTAAADRLGHYYDLGSAATGGTSSVHAAGSMTAGSDNQWALSAGALLSTSSFDDAWRSTQLVTQVDATNSTTTGYAWDASTDQLLTTTWPDGTASVQGYDFLGRANSMATADGGTSTASFDEDELQGWSATTYDNATATPPAVDTSVENAAAISWSAAPSGTTSSSWSTQLLTYLEAPAAGDATQYRLTSDADSSATLWVNGECGTSDDTATEPPTTTTTTPGETTTTSPESPSTTEPGATGPAPVPPPAQGVPGVPTYTADMSAPLVAALTAAADAGSGLVDALTSRGVATLEVDAGGRLARSARTVQSLTTTDCDIDNTVTTTTETAQGDALALVVQYVRNGTATSASAPASITVEQQVSGGGWEALDVTSLDPGYGLTTTVTSTDTLASGAAASTLATTTEWADPTLGQVDTTTYPGLSGALTVTGGYESTYDPTADAWARLTSETSPGGSSYGSTWWGNTETPTNPCDGSTVSQGGRAKASVMADPATGAATGETTTSYYDAAGRLTAAVDAPTGASAAVTSCRGYDDRGRQSTFSVDDPNGIGGTMSTAWSYSADSLTLTAVASFGDPPSCANGGTQCSTSITVDLLGRPVAATDVWGATTAIDYAIDPAEDTFSQVITSVVTVGSYTSSLVTSANRDGSTASITRTDNSAATVTLGATFAYTDGRAQQVTYTRDGAELVTLVASYAATGGGAVTGATWSQAGATVVDDQLDLSTNSSRTLGETISVGGVTYEYDFTFADTGWLSGATLSSSDGSVTGSWTNEYAAGSGTNPNAHLNGNPSSRTSTVTTPDGTTDTTTTWGYDFADRLDSSSDPAVATVVHDDFGNMTTYGDLTFAYDQLGHTLGAGDADDSVAYERFPDGTLLAKTSTIGGIASTVRYGPGGLMLDESSTPMYQVLSLGALVVTVDLAAGTNTSYQITSLQSGSALLALDASGTPATAPSLYDPFGVAITDPVAVDTTVPSYRWVATSGNETQVIDEANDLGFVMMGARPYLADLGRFTSADPTHGSDLNQYSYADNDPINQADPSGQSASQQTGALFIAEPGALVSGILIGAFATGAFLPSAALALLSAYDLSAAAGIFLAGAGIMVGAMVVAAGVGVLIAYGVSKVLGIPVSPLTLGIGALSGEVGGLIGFWARMAYGLRSAGEPPVVDIDVTVTESGPVQASVYPEPVDYDDMGDLQSLEESSEGGALGDLAGSGGDVADLDDIADLDEALEAMAVLLGGF